MSLTLSCELWPDEQRPETYWWPLLFETMRRLDFAFGMPGSEAPSGYYLLTTNQNTEVIEGADFLRLWRDIYSGQGPVYAVSWSRVVPDFVVNCGVTRRENGAIKILFDMQGESLMMGRDVTETDTPIARLRHWLDGVRLLYGSCAPATVELGHEHAGVYYRMGTIGKPLVPESFANGADSGEPYEATIAREPFPDGAMLSIVNPVTLPHGVGKLRTLG